MRSSPNYGIDAPGVIVRFLVLGGTGVMAALALRSTRVPWMFLPLFCMSVPFLFTSLVMLWGTKVGKLRFRDRLIENLRLQPNERVLDVGCGHGLLLIAAAKRLINDKAVGIDLWQTRDQAGNSRDATMQNARLEGVADRIELHEADARKMPFGDETFDVVVSSWALHNIYDPAERRKALAEIARVLKLGGRLAIVDIRHSAEYGRVLHVLCFTYIIRSPPNFLFVTPSH